MSYDEVDLEDMDWNEELQAFTYQCPCGDLFQITTVGSKSREHPKRFSRCLSHRADTKFCYDPATLRQDEALCGPYFSQLQEELAAGEDIAHCPSCSLYVIVIYKPDEIHKRVQNRQAQRLPVAVA